MSSLHAALAIGRGWRRQLGLAFAGIAAFGILAIYLLNVECAPSAGECIPELGIFYASFVLAGWLVGVVVAVLGRRLSARGRR